LVTGIESALQGGKADPITKKVWGWGWSIGWLIVLWVCIGWMAIVADIMWIGAPLVTAGMLIISVIGMIICHMWAPLYWKNYSFSIQDERIIIKRGVISKRKVSIPYERIQNVNIVKGVLDRIYKVSNIQIETAGSSGVEGTFQGILDPEPIEKFILEKVKAIKAGNALGDMTTRTQSPGTPLKVKMVLKALEIVCPDCCKEFTVNDKRRPFRITCPHCGVKGEIEEEKRVSFSIPEEEDMSSIKKALEKNHDRSHSRESDRKIPSIIEEYIVQLDLDEEIAQILYDGGYWSIEELEEAAPGDLRLLDGISPTLARKICEKVKK